MITANEKSNKIFTVAFVDENGDATTPDSILWSLVDEDGNVINSRCDVSVAPASSVDIILQGDDLAMTSDSLNTESRSLIVKTEYTSSEYGELPLTNSVEFFVLRIVGYSC